MRHYQWTLAALLALSATALNAQPRPGTPEALIAAAKQALSLISFHVYFKARGGRSFRSNGRHVPGTNPF